MAFDSLVRELQSEFSGVVLVPRSDMSEKDLRTLKWRYGPWMGTGPFERCLAVKSGSPNALEIIVRPGSFGIALVHAPDGASGYPLPFGYASTAPEVVKELSIYLSYLATDAQPEDVLWQRPDETHED